MTQRYYDLYLAAVSGKHELLSFGAAMKALDSGIVGFNAAGKSIDWCKDILAGIAIH